MTALLLPRKVKRTKNSEQIWNVSSKCHEYPESTGCPVEGFPSKKGSLFVSEA